MPVQPSTPKYMKTGKTFGIIAMIAMRIDMNIPTMIAKMVRKAEPTESACPSAIESLVFAISTMLPGDAGANVLRQLREALLDATHELREVARVDRGGAHDHVRALDRGCRRSA